MSLPQVSIAPSDDLCGNHRIYEGFLQKEQSGKKMFFITRGVYMNAGDERAYWYPLVVRVLTAVADCIRKGFKNIDDATKEAITDFAISATQGDTLSLDKSSDQIVGVELPMQFLEQDPPEENKFPITQKSRVVFYKSVKDGDPVITFMDINLVFDYRTFMILNRSFARINRSKTGTQKNTIY